MTNHTIFADYHFHPNFHVPSRWKSKARRIWDAFTVTGLDAVVVCEHSYKNPVDAYIALEGMRPKGHHTILLPGVEVLTEEGLDIVVFGHDPAWYEDSAYDHLLTPYHPAISEVITLVKNSDDLSAYIPHPFTAGTTGVIKHFGIEGSMRLITRLGGVETSNNSFSDTLHLTERIGERWFPNTFDRMKATQDLHIDFLDALKVDFYAVGSDAHFPEELGYGVQVEHPRVLGARDEAFEVLIANQNHLGINKHHKLLASRLFHCYKSALITGHEYLQKRVIRASLRRNGKPVYRSVAANG